MAWSVAPEDDELDSTWPGPREESLHTLNDGC